MAWHIARRPGGVIAGALQYRHHAIQMFEDYAGTSSSGFRAEVEAEQALTRGEHLLAMTDQHEHQELTGPAAAEAARRLASFAGRARFAGQVTTDPRRLARLMANHDPAIYPGTYVTCIYSHAKALCTPQHRARSSRLSEPDRQNVVVVDASSAGDADVGEQGHHLQAERLEVPVDVGPVAGRPADPRVGDAGQEGRDDVLAEGEQGADDAGGTG